jgi:hypothetical protein
MPQPNPGPSRPKPSESSPRLSTEGDSSFLWVKLSPLKDRFLRGNRPRGLQPCYALNPEGILYIPIHDGWLGIETDEELIARTVRECFFARLGQWVTITRTKLATGEKTILMAGPL